MPGVQHMATKPPGRLGGHGRGPWARRGRGPPARQSVRSLAAVPEVTETTYNCSGLHFADTAQRQQQVGYTQFFEAIGSQNSGVVYGEWRPEAWTVGSHRAVALAPPMGIGVRNTGPPGLVSSSEGTSNNFPGGGSSGNLMYASTDNSSSSPEAGSSGTPEAGSSGTSGDASSSSSGSNSSGGRCAQTSAPGSQLRELAAMLEDYERGVRSNPKELTRLLRLSKQAQHVLQRIEENCQAQVRMGHMLPTMANF
mmetsp:Transcript_92318/g.260239  ORF Transcript_92318/g.260239 Transcript_92318/m.260239 type:complete len:253 (+) Transcript_92318:54-812(+)